MNPGRSKASDEPGAQQVLSSIPNLLRMKGDCSRECSHLDKHAWPADQNRAMVWRTRAAGFGGGWIRLPVYLLRREAQRRAPAVPPVFPARSDFVGEHIQDWVQPVFEGFEPSSFQAMTDLMAHTNPDDESGFAQDREVPRCAEARLLCAGGDFRDAHRRLASTLPTDSVERPHDRETTGTGEGREHLRRHVHRRRKHVERAFHARFEWCGRTLGSGDPERIEGIEVPVDSEACCPGSERVPVAYLELGSGDGSQLWDVLHVAAVGDGADKTHV
jgi:hypothetical protein